MPMALYEQLAKLATASTDPFVYGPCIRDVPLAPGRGTLFGAERGAMGSTRWRQTATHGLTFLAEAIARQEDQLRSTTPSSISVRRVVSTSEAWRSLPWSRDRPEIRGRTIRCREAGRGRSEPDCGAFAAVLALPGRAAWTRCLTRIEESSASRAASTLAERAESLAATRMAGAMGRRLEWPPERSRPSMRSTCSEGSASRLRRAARPPHGQRVIARGRSIAKRSYKMLRYVPGGRLVLGEVRYARQWLERSGKTAEYVRRGRERHAMLVAQAASEAARRASAPRR
jgi:hypothetical protein